MPKRVVTRAQTRGRTRKTVYVVTIGFDYEGQMFLGAFGTLAKAQKFLATHEGYNGDSQYIYATPLNAPSETHVQMPLRAQRAAPKGRTR